MTKNKAQLPDGVTLHEIDPAKFYIIDIDGKKVRPWQVDDLRNELQRAGVKAGFMVASEGGDAVKIREAADEAPEE